MPVGHLRHHRVPKRLSLLVFALFFLIIEAQDQDPSSHPSSSFLLSPVTDEYIVLFGQRLAMGEQEARLSLIMGPASPDSWEMVSRSNPATVFLNTSDFTLIKLFDIGLLEALKARADMSVVPQKMIRHKIVQTATSDEESVMEPGPRSRKLLGIGVADSIPFLLGADKLWARGFTGAGVNVAVFDTGLADSHPHFRNVVARWDFTDDGIVDDIIGHGTFVAGVIASQSQNCPGFAPDALIHSYRVFTSRKVSYTSWFLDALNHAIFSGIDVLNLSIGGPDFLDRPFVDKILEASANDIIVISAIGNDGPLYGTLNNPGDQPDVIGVGGITFEHKMAPFSSRGMTTWELPKGYGRVKPDLVAFSESVSGSHVQGGCRTLSGTSVASPVVAGVVTLLASTLLASNRPNVINPGSMKQILLEATERLDTASGGGNIFEQGFGQLNLLDSFEILDNYVPRASLLPSSLDFTDCPYMWPFCVQPLFATSAPLQFNVTILNGMSVTGHVVEGPSWHPGINGEGLLVSFETSPVLWPYTGQLALRISVDASFEQFGGVAEGVVTLTVESPSMTGGMPLRSDLVLPVRVRVIPRPPRAKRILWDQFHNLRYPLGYFPRDALWVTNQPFDWNADHIHTNFRELFTHLTELGFYIDVLGEPFTCFDASVYGTLLVVDPEEEYFREEIKKVYEDVTLLGLSLVVVADWYNADLLQKLKFFDENTRQWWTPATGGANIPAINDLLASFGISFGSRVFDGEFSIDSKLVHYASGNAIRSFPHGGRMLMADLFDQGAQLLQTSADHRKQRVPVLGFLPDAGQGRVAVYGDSNLLDSAHQRKSSWWLAKSIFQFASSGTVTADLKDVLVQVNADFLSPDPLPSRLVAPASSLHLFSKVLDQALPVCSVHQWFQDQPPADAMPFKFAEPRLYSPEGAAAASRPMMMGFGEIESPGSAVSSFTLVVGAIAVFCSIFLVIQLRRRIHVANSNSFSSPDRPEP